MNLGRGERHKHSDNSNFSVRGMRGPVAILGSKNHQNMNIFIPEPNAWKLSTC